MVGLFGPTTDSDDSEMGGVSRNVSAPLVPKLVRHFASLPCYQDYLPQFPYWKLVLLIRKFLFAMIVVLVNRNLKAQVESCAGL